MFRQSRKSRARENIFVVAGRCSAQNITTHGYYRFWRTVSPEHCATRNNFPRRLTDPGAHTRIYTTPTVSRTNVTLEHIIVAPSTITVDTCLDIIAPPSRRISIAFQSTLRCVITTLESLGIGSKETNSNRTVLHGDLFCAFRF